MSLYFEHFKLLVFAVLGIFFLNSCADDIVFPSQQEEPSDLPKLFISDREQSIDSITLFSEIIDVTVPNVNKDFSKLTLTFYLPNEEYVRIIFAGFTNLDSGDRCIDLKTYGETNGDGICLPEDFTLYTGSICEFVHFSYTTPEVEHGSAFDGAITLQACSEATDKLTLSFNGKVQDDSYLGSPIISVRGSLTDFKYIAQ